MGIPGYDCIVYHKGKQVYRHFAGYADKENQILMNAMKDSAVKPLSEETRPPHY